MPTQTPSTGRPAATRSAMMRLTRDFSQARHARLESADAGHHQSVGGRGGTRVGGHLDRRADPLQCALGRP